MLRRVRAIGLEQYATCWFPPPEVRMRLAHHAFRGGPRDVDGGGPEMVASPVAESLPVVTSDSARKRGVVVLHGRIVGVPLHPSDIAVGKYCVEAIEVVLPSGADVSDIVNDRLGE